MGWGLRGGGQGHGPPWGQSALGVPGVAKGVDRRGPGSPCPLLPNFPGALQAPALLMDRYERPGARPIVLGRYPGQGGASRWQVTHAEGTAGSQRCLDTEDLLQPPSGLTRCQANTMPAGAAHVHAPRWSQEPVSLPRGHEASETDPPGPPMYRAQSLGPLLSRCPASRQQAQEWAGPGGRAAGGPSGPGSGVCFADLPTPTESGRGGAGAPRSL